MKELTDKTWGIQTRSFGVVWLTETEAQAAKNAYVGGATYLDLGDLLISRGDIAGFARGEMLRDVERKKQGDWYCEKHTQWIPKGKTCGYC